jgi:peptidoglycan/LPS O-acetylase OafA/YrhL
LGIPATISAPLTETRSSTSTPSELGPTKSERGVGHVPELDGVRGLAILMVLVFHYVGLARRGNAIYAATAHVVSGMWSGVDLFFVLSGFLITGILVDSVYDRSFFRKFYIRRALRIFPLYYAVLTFALLILPRLVPFTSLAARTLLSNQVWLWCYGVNIDIALKGNVAIFQCEWVWMHHLWSLAVENHFYLVWPLVVFFCRRTTLFWVCVGCLVAAPVFRVVLVLGGAAPIANYVLTPSRLDALAMGGLLSLVVRRGKPLTSYSKPAILALVLTTPALAGLSVWEGALEGENARVQCLGYSLLAVWAGGLLMAAISLPAQNLLRRGMRSRVLKSFGKYSYGIYVFHMVMLPWYEDTFSTKRIERLVPSYLAAGLLHFTLAVVFSFGLAYASWHLFEKHFLDLKRFFTYRVQKVDKDSASPAV